MDLIERIIKNDEAALRELMYIYGNELLRTAILLVKDYQTAEEIVQDTFITAFEKMIQLKDKSKLNSWLIMITINGCRTKMRRWSWKNIVVKNDRYWVDEASGDEPEKIFFNSIQNASLHEEIQALSYNYREVIVLYYFHELSVNEISRRKHIYRRTIRKKSHSIRSVFRCTSHIERKCCK